MRHWKFENFADAIAFVNRVAEAAEEANHHPDILVYGWNKVRLSLTNHSAGGLTDPDFEHGQGLRRARLRRGPWLTESPPSPSDLLLPFRRVAA